MPGAHAEPSGPGVTVLGNLAVDRIDGAAPTPGGCPVFAGPALLAARAPGRIVTRAAAADLPLFADVLAGAGVPVSLLPAGRTSAFGMHYTGDDRAMTVDAIGPSWTPADLRAAAITTAWVHVAPLLRTDLPGRALHALAADGHRIAYDGQGLVRRPQVGGLVTEAPPADERRAILGALSVLKLSGEEADALVGPGSGPAAIAALGVPEVLVTAGSLGCTLHLAGAAPVHVPPAWTVDGVHATGAGDAFTVAYVGSRSLGEPPAAAAAAASQVVAEMLQTRRETQGGGGAPGPSGQGRASRHRPA